MKIEDSGIWLVDRDEFANGLRAFLRPVVSRALLELALAILGMVVCHRLVPSLASDWAWTVWVGGYGLSLVSRGLWWLYQPR